MNKLNIGFVCVHNSCRSQMAEAICKLKFNDTFNCYSAGTQLKDKINQDAVMIIKKKYNYDMELCQRSKLIDELPVIDVLVTMGCNVSCPSVFSKYKTDFNLDDPTGENEMVFNLTSELIYEKLLNLKHELVTKGLL